MGGSVAMTKQNKAKLDNRITEVVSELVGEEALAIVEYLRGKSKISEFIIAEELDLEIHRTRHILYKLLENNLASFIRKKDKIKGWYICYWDFNEKIVDYLFSKMNKEKADKMRERLQNEETNHFFMCKNACTRMNFDKVTEFLFKCPECGEIMNQLDNTRTIEFLKKRIEELEAET